MKKTKNGRKNTKINIFAILLFILINSFFFLFTIAPDYLGIFVDRPFSNWIYYLPVIASTFYFCVKYKSETKAKNYFINVFTNQFLTLIVPFLLLLPMSFRINELRCQATGFCVGGEPFDHMSTIFLILILLAFSFRTFVLTIIVGVIFRIRARNHSNKNLKK